MSRRPQSARAPVEPDEELSFEQLFERRNQQQRQKAFAASNRDDSDQDDSEGDEQPAQSTVKQPKKKNKDKPIEMSSKRPVPRLKSVFPQASKAFQPRDPRFDPMCGELDRRHFRASYGFIDELRQNEIGALRKELQKVKSDDKRVELQTVLGQYTQEQKHVEKTDRLQSQMSAWKSKERERVKEGKKPFFLKESTVSQLAQVDEFEQLKKKGKLESYMAKRRQKNMAKDHRYLPYARRDE